MSWYAIDTLEDAYEASKEFLFPFDKWTWLKLALIAFFVGSGFGNPTSFTNFGGPTPENGGTQPTPEISIAVILFVVAILLVIGLIFGLISSVMQFVLYDSLRNREVKILRYFTRHLWNGVQLLLFQIAVGIAIIAPIVLVALLLFGVFGPVGLVGLFLLIPVFILLFILFALVHGFTVDFVVPVMMVREEGIITAWRSYWPNLKEDWKQYGVYVLMKLVLSIAVGIIVFLALMAGAILLLLPFAVVALVIIAAAGGFDPSAWGAATLAALVLLGAVYLLILLVYSLLVQVPVMTYFRYYALMVLGDSREEFDLIPDQRSEVRTDGGNTDEVDESEET